MKYQHRLLLLLACSGLSHGALAAPFVVHEWGTFTSVSGSDGVLLSGLEREEHFVPPFVHSHAGFFPANKGWSRPVANVTIKMETPVIYFYSDVPRRVAVDVGFRGGSISQWYPDRSGGEKMSPLAQAMGSSPVGGALEKMIPAVDFGKNYQGSASWKIEVLAPKAADEFSSKGQWENPEVVKRMPFLRQWPLARVSAANKVRGPAPKSEVEGFIFYRGIGNFPLPLAIKSSDERLLLSNSGADPISFLFVYEKTAALPHGVVRWSGALPAGAREMVPLKTPGNAAEPLLTGAFPRALEHAGLTPEEARALIASWQESYFERDGLRVFWIVPRGFTDAVLPMTITPKPDRLERVLVGRTEVLTPAFEAQLRRDFAADRGQRWAKDRYYFAYLERTRQLGVVLAAARP